MDEYDKKYGIDSDTPDVMDFHKRRVMFCIRDGKVFLAPKNVTYTHAVWFHKMGWIKPGDDALMETMVRGFFVDNEIYFYTGYDFRLTDDCEKILFSHVRELASKTGLPLTARVFGGMVRTKPGEKFKPIKEYGTLKDIMGSK